MSRYVHFFQFSKQATHPLCMYVLATIAVRSCFQFGNRIAKLPKLTENYLEYLSDKNYQEKFSISKLLTKK